MRNRSVKCRAMASNVICVLALGSNVNVCMAAPAELFGIFLAPTLPVASTPFTIHVRFQDVGAPVTVVQSAVHLAGTNLSVTACMERGSSITSPTTVNLAVNAPILPIGKYTATFTRSYFVSPASDCQNPVQLFETRFDIVSTASIANVVEYYDAPRDHYFQTAIQAEIDILDSGVISGWSRTGESFQAYQPGVAGSVSPVVVPVCRYYGRPEFQLDTHFFSAFRFECDAILRLWPSQWIEETSEAFGATVPFESDGSCRPGTVPVYRLFNGKTDVNHRYTTSLTLRSEMVESGWISEGLGPLGVGMCAEDLPAPN